MTSFIESLNYDMNVLCFIINNFIVVTLLILIISIINKILLKNKKSIFIDDKKSFFIILIFFIFTSIFTHYQVKNLTYKKDLIEAKEIKDIDGTAILSYIEDSKLYYVYHLKNSSEVKETRNIKIIDEYKTIIQNKKEIQVKNIPIEKTYYFYCDNSYYNFILHNIFLQKTYIEIESPFSYLL